MSDLARCSVLRGDLDSRIIRECGTSDLARCSVSRGDFDSCLIRKCGTSSGASRGVGRSPSMATENTHKYNRYKKKRVSAIT